MRALLALTLAFLGAAPSVAAGVSARERAIAARVDASVPAGLTLLERTVNMNSGTLNPDGVRSVGRAFTPAFEALGFRIRWIDGAAWGRAGHLVATRVGRAGGANAKRLHVLLIGHLDTVFERDSPFQRFERLTDSTASGPGAIDMKGGIVVMWLALQALEAAGELERLDCTVFLCGDEERSGEPLALARRDLIAAADAADVALGFEDGAGDPRTAVVSRRSSGGWVLRTTGKPYHSSQIFRADVGYGSIFEAARILNAWRDSLAGEALLTFNPGVVLGGTRAHYDEAAGGGGAFGKTNVVAESTVVAGDLRALSLEQREAARAAMRRVAARNLPHASATLEFEDGYPPLAPSEGNRRLLAMYDQASRDLGHGPVAAVDPARAGAADISFCEGRVEMALDGIGLMGDGGHTVGEVADLRTLGSQARRVAVLLSRLGRGAK
ncbi:MAG: M20/M25/M40 family metallo-hydrolase [Candidatus Eisenbacteria bacterium]|uniref:M20/M25/M40 family metallo-hydrolase n=1 Tax=Eiseniibacteriota bacterium TaxID=2212470 RepID=A0A849SL20_UNCEI|nr:M20/M25/M40 family metallo-hydrolase [Candidatus Eisenbacteria bacterium]